MQPNKLKRKRQFQVKADKTSADELQEVLKYHYPPGTVTVETRYFVTVICDRDGQNTKNLVAEDIQGLLHGIPNAKVKFHNEVNILPEIPADIKIHYYIDKDSLEKYGGDYRTPVEIATQKMIETSEWNDTEQLEIIEQMLKKVKMGDYSGGGGEYWYEMSPKEITAAFAKDKEHFVRSKKPLSE